MIKEFEDSFHIVTQPKLYNVRQVGLNEKKESVLIIIFKISNSYGTHNFGAFAMMSIIAMLGYFSFSAHLSLMRSHLR